MRTLSIDPGERTLAWALWADNQLLTCKLSRVAAASAMRMPLGELAIAHADNVNFIVDQVVIEEMRHYPGRDTPQASAAKAADLLRLQAIGGIVAGRCVGPRGPVRYLPALEWKGQVPKEVTQHRVRRALNAEELERLDFALAEYPKGLGHNLYDAVGIGLSFLGRVKK